MRLISIVLASVLGFSGLALAQETKTPVAATPETSAPSARQGAETIKEGAGKVGQGVSKVVNSTALEAKSVICPVVAETATKVYYAKDSKGYYEVLKFAAPDKDEGTICFRSEATARERGFKAVGN
ncbi:MAG: hypothetical protein H7318_13305 [Oligoflexus sp.]|nr:hypothetical protein [Oligoflexus sp.]